MDPTNRASAQVYATAVVSVGSASPLFPPKRRQCNAASARLSESQSEKIIGARVRRFAKLAAETQDGRLSHVRRLVSGLGRVKKERQRSLAARRAAWHRDVRGARPAARPAL